MSDIFREVDEALQREKAEKFWKEYGPTLIAAAVLLVIGTAIGVAWRTWDHHRDATETARLIAAVNQDGDGSALDNIIADSRSGPEAIAMLTAAGRLSAEGKQAEAAALYKQAAENRTLPRDMRDLARIYYVRLVEDANAADHLSILKPVLDRPDGPFIWHGRIEAARLYASRQDFQAAYDVLAPFSESDAGIPDSLKQRGLALRQIYKQSIAAE